MFHRSTWIYAGSGTGTVLICQFIPGLNTLNHEFTTLLTFIAVGYFFFASSRRCTESAPYAHRSLWRRWGDGLALGTGAFATAVVANLLGPGCEIMQGAGYFWTTYLPAIFFITTLGTILAQVGFRLRVRIPLYILLFLLCSVHDALQCLVGPRAIPVDLILGELQAFNQRAEMACSVIHFRQRGVLLLLTLLLWAVVKILHMRRQSPRSGAYRWALSGAALYATALVVGVAFVGSHVGVGWGYGRLNQRLDKTIESEHFVMHLAGFGQATLESEAILRQAEWDFHHLADLWSITPAKKVQLFVYEDEKQMTDLTGIAAAHATVHAVHIPVWEATSSVLLHELVHALHIELDPSIRVVQCRGLLEGTAMAFEDGYFQVDEAHRVQAQALAQGNLPSAQAVMAMMGFSQVSEYAAYWAAGSFLGFLVKEHGFEKFRRLQQTLDYQAVYGMDLAGLDTQWRAFLANIPTRSEDRRRADIFDRRVNPAYLDNPCPKLGRVRPEDLEVQLALDFWRSKDYLRAHEMYWTLFQKHVRAGFAITAAQVLAESGDKAGAVATLQRAMERTDLGESDRADLLATMINYLMLHRKWEDLEAALDRRQKEQGKVSLRDRMIEESLRDPQIREEMAQALLTDQVDKRKSLLEGLLQRKPGSTTLRYLYAVKGLIAEPQLQVQEMIRLVPTSPEMADHLGEWLLGSAKSSLDSKNYEMTGRISRLILVHCRDGLVRYRAELLQQRINFELDQQGIP